MPVPNAMSDLSQLPGSNYPVGSEAIGNNLDNYLRAHAALIRQSNAMASSSMPSGSTVNVAISDGEAVIITGDATITSLGTGFVGCKRELRFTGVSTLVHSSSLQLPMGVNVVTAQARCFEFRCIAPGIWVMTSASHGYGYLPDWATTDPASVQPALGFTPVRQGGGSGQLNNTLRFGWTDAGKVAVQVDATNLGALALESWTNSNFYPKSSYFRIKSNEISVGSDGLATTDVLSNVVAAGSGKSEYINTRGAGVGGHSWYSREATSASPIELMALDRFGNLYTTGSLNVAGNVTATGDVTGLSDLRLKFNVRPITGALELVRALQGVRYTKDGRESIGFGAQPFGEVLPELRHIQDDEMGTQSIAYGNVTAVLAEAIKELADRFDRAGV